MPGPLGGGRKRQIGQLRHRLEIHAPTTTPDRFLAPVKAWVVEATVWGNVDLTGGVEDIRQGGGIGAQANVSGTVTLRYRAGLDPTRRLVWKRTDGDMVLNIVAAPPAEGVANFIRVLVKSEPGAVPLTVPVPLDGGTPTSEYPDEPADGGTP